MPPAMVIQVHCSLAAHPMPVNLVLASRSQALIGDTSVVLLRRSPSRGTPLPRRTRPSGSGDRIRQAPGTGSPAVGATSARPTTVSDPARARAAGKVRAAYGEFTHDTTILATPTPTPTTIATHPALAQAVRASLDALEAAAELASIVSGKATTAT